MVNYRGYLIHFRTVLSWRFMAAPASPELPILSRGVSRLFFSRDEALAEARTPMLDGQVLEGCGTWTPF